MRFQVNSDHACSRSKRKSLHQRGFDSRLTKVTSKIHRELVAIATANLSILAIFANLEAKNAEIMYFTRSLLPDGLRKFYKNNYITTKPHLRAFQNANIYFDDIFICVIFLPTDFHSLAVFKNAFFTLSLWLKMEFC